MLQKIYFMVFERYIPELKKYDSISFLHQPMTSGQPLQIVQRHMAHPVYVSASFLKKCSFTEEKANNFIRYFLFFCIKPLECRLFNYIWKAKL